MNAEKYQDPASRSIVIELHDAMWDDSHAASGEEDATDTRRAKDSLIAPGAGETLVDHEALIAGAQNAENKTTSYKAGLVALRKMGWTIYLSTPNFGHQIKGFHEALSKLLRAQGIAFGRHSLVRNLLVISIAAADNRVALPPGACSSPLPPQARYPETLKGELEKVGAQVYVCASPKMLQDVGSAMGPERIKLILFGPDVDDRGKRLPDKGQPMEVGTPRGEDQGSGMYQVAEDWEQLVEMCGDTQVVRRASV